MKADPVRAMQCEAALCHLRSKALFARSQLLEQRGPIKAFDSWIMWSTVGHYYLRVTAHAAFGAIKSNAVSRRPKRTPQNGRFDAPASIPPAETHARIAPQPTVSADLSFHKVD